MPVGVLHGDLFASGAAHVTAWWSAQRVADRIPGGGGDRGRGPRTDDPAGRRRARSVVAVAAAALHRLRARPAPGEPPGAAALARAARYVAPGRRARRPGGDRPAADRAARGGGGDGPRRPGPVARRVAAARRGLLRAPVGDRARARARRPAVLPRHREPRRGRAGERAVAVALASDRRGARTGRRQQPPPHA